MLKYKFEMIKRVPESFLDIGCSESVWIEAYKKINGGEAAGIEVSVSKIERAKKRNLDVGNYDDIEGKFEFVYLRHVIEHIEKPAEFVEMIMQKYVADNGYLFIETPNNDNFCTILNGRRIREDRFCKDLYPPTHVCGFTPYTFKKWTKYNLIDVGTFSLLDKHFWYDVLEPKNKLKMLVHWIFLKLDYEITLYAILSKNRENN